MWKVPLFDINFGAEEKNAVTGVLDSGWLTMGETTLEFERRFAEFIGVRHAVAVCNGTAALHLAHISLGLGAGDEVICPSLTFVAGANSIIYCGARCVFADIISDSDLTISPVQIESKIGVNTKAIQVMHYGGYLCDMEAITEIAKHNGLFVIEDCAHSPGSELGGVKCGTFGDVGCFSFFSNKNCTTGEGGMVVTNSDELAERIRLMRSHGMTTLTLDRHKGHAFSYDVVERGYNYRMDEMRAALGLVQLEKLSSYNSNRKQLAEIYRYYLKDIEGVSMPFNEFRGSPVYHLFPILVKNNSVRMDLMGHLKNDGIQTSIHYPPIHLFSEYRKQSDNGWGTLSVTEDVASREITLPMYPSMREDNVKYVCDAVYRFFEGGEKA